MPTHVRELAISNVLLFQPRVFTDQRGSFVEMWNAAREFGAGFDEEFVQDNVAISHERVLRGLHFQHPDPQGKFVTAAFGAIYDVVVDLRPDSPTIGKWIAVELAAESGAALYIPPGFAHGYQVLSKMAAVVYKCTTYYKGENDQAMAWNDATLSISWPLENPILSEKDAAAPSFQTVRTRLGL